MLAILVIPCFARLDRDFDFRAVTCPLDRAQDAPIRFIRDQSQQLSLFFVKLLKGEFPISRGTTVTHGYSTPTHAAEQGSSTIGVICSSEELLGAAASIAKMRVDVADRQPTGVIGLYCVGDRRPLASLAGAHP